MKRTATVASPDIIPGDRGSKSARTGPRLQTLSRETRVGARLRGHVRDGAAVGLLLVIVVAAALVYPAFDTRTNIENLLRQSVPLGLVAVGMTLVLIVGEFDVSVGAISGGAGVLFAGLAVHLPMGLALLGAIGAGVTAGLFNAFLVTVLGLPSFMATFGSSLIFLGAGLTYSGAAINVTSSSVLAFGHPQLAGLPADVIATAGVFVVVGFLLAKTRYGRALYAVGGNQEAARLAGLRVGLAKASTFVLVGATSALAGVVTVSQSASGNATDGAGLALSAIATVVIGGTSIWGGRGAVWRTAVGVLILAVLGNVFDGLSLPSASQLVVSGLAVVAAISFQRRA